MFCSVLICFDSTIIGDQNIRYLCHFKADLRAIRGTQKSGKVYFLQRKKKSVNHQFKSLATYVFIISPQKGKIL